MANEWLQMLQDVSSNPNVAYGLLILGLWAGMVAWAVPGTGLPEAAAVAWTTFCPFRAAATASAWMRSRLPLRNARSVNSPGSASRAPALIALLTIAPSTTGLPCG